MSDLVHDLVRSAQFSSGSSRRKIVQGNSRPWRIRLGLLPPYPSILRALAQEIVPLVRVDGVTHLLAAPNAVPLGVAVSLAADMPLVYPTSGDPDGIEGAYDYSVPTVLLTDLLSDGSAERALIKRVKSVGLEVRAVVAVLALGTTFTDVEINLFIWHSLPDLLPKITTPAIASAVRDWLTAQNPRI